MKCCICNRSIKNPLYFDGKTYGKECWKQHALPKIEELQKNALEKWQLECKPMLEILAQKNINKLSQFKYDVIASILEKGYMSKKQYEMINEWLTKKEQIKLMLLEYEYGFSYVKDEILSLIFITMETNYSNFKPKDIKPLIDLFTNNEVKKLCPEVEEKRINTIWY